MIVELGEVTNHNTNYARIKAVDATNKTQFIHVVCSLDFCFLLEGVHLYYHLEQFKVLNFVFRSFFQIFIAWFRYYGKARVVVGAICKVFLVFSTFYI